MKKIGLLLIICFMVVSCMAAAPSKVCPPLNGEKSWICEKSIKSDITPEQVYGWIFSASAIAAVTDVAEIGEICAFKKKIDDWYMSVRPVSYDAIIDKVLEELKLLKDARKILLIKNILNQNVMMYSNWQLVDDYDDWMLRAGSAKFNRDMMCE